MSQNNNEAKKDEQLVNCAKCPSPVCNTRAFAEGPENCPLKLKPDVIKRATETCLGEDFLKFAYLASKQEGSGYLRAPHAPKGPSPIKSRLEEVMEFAQRMGYKRLGVAYCGGVQFEAGMLVPILESKGFEVVSACCKCGSVSKAALGLEEWEQIAGVGQFEAMCHPIAQAEILNSYNTDFNIMLCLCVGHDSLFLKHSKAPCTVLATKDRVYGHAPLMALYQSRSYHRRVLAKETYPDAAKEAERDGHL